MRGGLSELREDGCVFSPLYFSQTRGSASAAEPPGCSSFSFSPHMFDLLLRLSAPPYAYTHTTFGLV